MPPSNVGNRAILSLDAVKAFDGVERGYLWQLLEKFNLGEEFITWVKLLYQAPTACLRINNTPSAPFRLSKGTRQGFPLSPLFCALTLQPLAAAIWGDLSGISEGRDGGEITIIGRRCFDIFGLYFYIYRSPDVAYQYFSILFRL